jgi:hypothetical protein
MPFPYFRILEKFAGIRVIRGLNLPMFGKTQKIGRANWNGAAA